MLNRIRDGFSLFLLLMLVVSVAISCVGMEKYLRSVAGMLFWCSWVPVISLFAAFTLRKKAVEGSLIFYGSFIGGIGFALFMTVKTASWVLTSGPLNEAALIFIVMPMGLLKWSLIGSAGGLAVAFWYWLARRA
ncbi:hypothetical protein [Microbulbifer sp. YPW1]|uniref:hypothetical protein n=1 Tax=Microbulbifer sp. YPW1 TaxID=2745199 RepID=UPI00159915E1|nr:hypothetical protein [Microbulbifer sp. YPW1]QKX17175.1 hypothetical protein HUW35_09290 [Microbulbifer sp. YPW1]